MAKGIKNKAQNFSKEMDKDKNKKNINETKKVVKTEKFSKIYENKNVKEILLKFFEDGCVDMLKELDDYICDEILSNRKNVRAPTVRKWLNLLHTHGLVEYSKTKDKQSGWFTYRWKTRLDKITEFAISEIDNEIENISKEMENIRVHNFVCDCMTWTYIEALESDFVCIKCQKGIVEKKGDGTLSEMESKKVSLEKKRKEILLSAS